MAKRKRIRSTSTEGLSGVDPDTITLACAGCRRESPDFWMVPPMVWEFYIEPARRRDILCFACWKRITTRRDNRSFEAAHGRPVGVPFWFPIEWETGEPMPLERWATHWPKDYPEPLNAGFKRLQHYVKWDGTDMPSPKCWKDG